MTEGDNFVSMTFDCKKAFVGEEAYVLIKFKNVGGEGRFFIMSEADWFSMNIIVKSLPISIRFIKKKFFLNIFLFKKILSNIFFSIPIVYFFILGYHRQK